MTPIYAATILLVAFAIGEIINVKTKARISSFLATSVILIALFWMGAPREIMTVTGFATVATTLYGLTMVNMGSMVKVRDMLSQWKTLIIGFCAVCAICLMITTVGPLLIDRRLAICGAPVVAGGTPVYLMVKEVADGAGFTEGSIFALLVLLTQTLVGVPISSIILRKQCRQLVDSGKLADLVAADCRAGGQYKTQAAQAHARSILQACRVSGKGCPADQSCNLAL